MAFFTRSYFATFCTSNWLTFPFLVTFRIAPDPDRGKCSVDRWFPTLTLRLDRRSSPLFKALSSSASPQAPGFVITEIYLLTLIHPFSSLEVSSYRKRVIATLSSSAASLFSFALYSICFSSAPNQDFHLRKRITPILEISSNSKPHPFGPHTVF